MENIKQELPTLVDFKSDKEQIELTLNARGNYSWCIKIKSDKLSEDDLKRLKEIDSQLFKSYGVKEE